MKHSLPLIFLFTAALFLTAQPLAAYQSQTHLAIVNGRWHINGTITYPGTPAEGLLLNARMVNAVFEDANNQTRPKDFDADANTTAFIARIPEYAAHGIRAFTLNLQGGMPNYDGAINSAFHPDGSLHATYLQRVRRVIEACDRHGVAVILGCFYQMQDQVLRDEAAVRAGVVNVARWLKDNGFTNVALEIANEYGHRGFDHPLLKTTEGQIELIRLAKQTAPQLLVSTAELGDVRAAYSPALAAAADFLLIHNNNRSNHVIPWQALALKQFNKPIIVNEDDKRGAELVQAAELSIANGISWGLMLKEVNQFHPFKFNGAADDTAVYATLKRLTTYFPPPESQGGWRKLDNAEDIRRLAGMNPDKLAELKAWLLQSDKRNFAAVVIRNGYVVLEVERNHSSATDTTNVKSCAKAICATVLAIAAEQSQQGRTPKKMSFDDPAFQFIPWAQPLSDPRKANITVRQLFNHTSGITPEAVKPASDTQWEKILGFTDDEITAKLAFDPGTASGYSTHAFHHAALVCETVTGRPYDQFAIETLFKPLGIEHWWFEYFESAKIGRHPSHHTGLPARALARIAYCMLNDGRWRQTQVIPRWFVNETAAPSHHVTSLEIRFKKAAQSFSHGWEIPALLGAAGAGIPADARYKPGSGGQLMAFVPSLNLVIARQTNGKGEWEYQEYLRRAVQAVVE